MNEYVDGKPAKTETTDHSATEAYEGNSFLANYYEVIGIAGTIKILFTTPADKLICFHDRIQATKETNWAVYVAPTVTGAGTTITPINRNQRIGGVSACTVTHTPTLSDDGAKVYESAWGTGVKIGGATEGEEIHLAQSTTYYFLITSAAATNKVTVDLHYCERPLT